MPSITQEELRRKINALIANADTSTSVHVTADEYVLSVDFIGKDEHFDTFNEYTRCFDTDDEPCPRGTSLEEWFCSFKNADLTNYQTGEELSYSVNMQLFREFIPQYFFRRYLTRDHDFKSENVCIIYNQKTGKYRLAPMFDMEYCYSLTFPINKTELDEDLTLA